MLETVEGIGGGFSNLILVSVRVGFQEPLVNVKLCRASVWVTQFYFSFAFLRSGHPPY